MSNAELQFNKAMGHRIKMRRKVLDYRSQDFAKMLGISHQQLYKYENGLDRISAKRIVEIARLLGVSTTYLFNDEAELGNITSILSHVTNHMEAENVAPELLDDKETRSLLKHYISIEDVRTRLALVDLVKSISKYITRYTKAS